MEHPIIVFDGVCNVCSRMVRFVLKRDQVGQIHFARMQSDAGAKLLEDAGLDSADPDSFLVVDEGVTLEASDAVLAILKKLKQPWPIIGGIYEKLPRPLRDRLYFTIAQNRYKWFGKSETCLIPPASVRQRFLD